MLGRRIAVKDVVCMHTTLYFCLSALLQLTDRLHLTQPERYEKNLKRKTSPSPQIKSSSQDMNTSSISIEADVVMCDN